MTGGRQQTIGQRYVLTRQIGRGGMGAVWLGMDEVLGREVAVKRLGLFPGGSSPDLLRGQREAKLAARLNHPHVVAVFDFVTQGDEQWLVMEYVPGTNLAALTEQHGGLPPTDAAAVLAQVAEALAVAHSAGIVHRDVKPSNILVTRTGTAKLADFGIARARADSTLTGSGMVTGSPAYLAPEVVSGRPATEESDVWSLGATLFHTLTGRSPYDVGDNVLSTMYAIVHEDPPRLPGAGWPAELLETMMAHDPADRWSMERVRDYLASGPPDAEVPGGTAPAPWLAPLPDADQETEVVRERTAERLVPPGAVVDDDEARPWVLPVVIGVVLLVVAAGLGWWLLGGGSTTTAGREPGSTVSSPAKHTASVRHSPTVVASATRTPSPTRSTGAAPKTGAPAQTTPSLPPSSSPTTSAATPSGPAAGGQVAQMRTFVQQYIAMALQDPDTSWRELTPRFQQTCCDGSVGNYAGYWRTIANATLRDVNADPGTMRVDYIITWDPVDRPPEDEHVTLGLVLENGRYLIDYEL